MYSLALYLFMAGDARETIQTWRISIHVYTQTRTGRRYRDTDTDMGEDTEIHKDTRIAGDVRERQYTNTQTQTWEKIEIGIHGLRGMRERQHTDAGYRRRLQRFIGIHGVWGMRERQYTATGHGRRYKDS